MLSVVAIVKIKDDSVELVKSEMLKMVESTIKEVGCISYTLHQDNENPNIFVFYESWSNEESLQQHLRTDHVQAYIIATKGCISEFNMHKLTAIS